MRLALDVAGAALSAERGVRSYAAYRDALADPSADELELAARFVGELPGGHEASITTTLARSIKCLDDAGLDFLRIASRLAVAPIAADLVVEAFAMTDKLRQRAARSRAVAAMHDATNRSLAETTTDDAYQVHTLISRTIRLLDGQRNVRPGRQRWQRLRRRRPGSTRAAKLADAAIATLTDRLHSTAAGRVSTESTTLAHARHLGAPLQDNGHAALLHAVAVHDLYRGDFRSARTLNEQVLAARRRLLGDQHPDTLAAMNNLAATLDAQGDLDGARALHEQVLAIRRQLVGDDDPATLASMGNLAETLRAQGDLDGARTLNEEVLAGSRRVLGDDHRDTLMTMNNLALVLQAQGDLDGARTLNEEVLAGHRRVLGDDHRDTLISMNNLALTLRAQGDLDGARTVHEQAVAAMRGVLGDEHPNTLLLMSNLADTLWAQGDLDGARILHEEVLAASRRVLGDEHAVTLRSKRALGEILSQLG